MTVLATSPRRQLAYRSPFLVDFRASDLFLPDGTPAVQGDQITTRSGHVITITRDDRSYSIDQNGRLGLAPKNAPRFGYHGGIPHLRLEAAATNLCGQPEDFSTTWTPTNMTVGANNGDAPDGTATADLLTATAGNATIIFDLGVISSAVKTFKVWLRRVTGSGNIDLTLDGGSTWTTKALTSSWQQFSITQTLANPDIGIRIVTNGDAIEAWGADAKALAFADTYATRVAETAVLPFGAPPGVYTVYEKAVEGGTILTANARRWQISNAAGADARLYVESTGSYYSAVHDPGSSSASTLGVAPAVGDVTEHLTTLSLGGSVQISQSVNAATAVTAAAGSDQAFASAWSGALLYLNSAGTSNRGFTALREWRLALGTKTMDEMRVTP